MFATLLCKLLQRKTYDVLAKKHTLLLLFVGLIIVFVSTLRFGETLIEWSKEKYSVVFSPYSNNILGKSYRNMLCQYVPIDVVYTWVNGSDPLFLKELAKAKEEYGFLNSHMNCSFSNCVKSHMVLVRPQFPNSMTLSDLEETDPVFQHISSTFVVASQQKSYENVTVLVFSSPQLAERVIAKKMIAVENQNYTLSRAYITDNWGSQNTVLLNSVFFLTQLPHGYSNSEILEKLPSNVRSAISEVFKYEEKSLAALTLNDPDILDSILKLNNITFGNKVASVSSAYLVIELLADHEDISASRFTDNEELRYSLRSLEKHAPWVQHIYIITNGQIPYWLNLDNPLVTIVTHEWGSSQSVLTSTFTSFIRPVIDYGSELLVKASNSSLLKLDIVQNKALRFITGAATSTPIASMQLQTEISSSSERRQYSALSLGERLIRKPTTYPGHLKYASANLDLVLPVHKHNSLLAELRSAALATIHERYRDQDWLHIFTDGSATASFGRAGAGAFSNSFNLKEPVTQF
ncbi:hypothetical protein TNCV_5118041 [Trichonephila clavipes]|nr:hypothetical protein TNCV_5118041 [Trichonephila clavipes]